MANPIDDNDELATALGRLVGRWGMSEFYIEMIYTLLSEMPSRKATITFSFFRSVGTQKDIIYFLVGETEWLPNKTKEEIKSAVTKFSKMAGRRNGYIHSPFGHAKNNDGDFEIYKTARNRTGEFLYSKKTVTPTSILKFADEVTEMNKRLFSAHLAIFEAYKTKLSAPLPYPSLLSKTANLHNAPKLPEEY